MPDHSPDCSICLNALDSERPLELTETRCGHVYHASCLKTWLRVQTTCPCCRTTLREPSMITSAAVEWDYDDICEWYFEEVDELDDTEDVTDSDDDYE